ncbi:GNAT family N-acetyltransferase [Aquimarina longa]|uniref:GNAT family N-acetyltransferase n=1 Tax=Aquimarina longa TaxID=1080221 RepID=UPI0007824CA6|nr:GNAT family N-acetyltransferase [Aquimarina longa]
MHQYLFKSERLGFRNWVLDDLESLTEINNDDDVMEFFPSKLSKKDTKEFIIRMQNMFDKKGFCYFAVDLLESTDFIGFIGICEQTYLEELGAFIDIGWRLQKNSWGKGYATEGAKACVEFGFKHIGITEIYAVAPQINKKSEAVMKKIGLQYIKTFEHPKLLNNQRLKHCLLYKNSH